MITLPVKYIELLARHGRDLKELGVNGMALPRRPALEAVEALRLAKIPILATHVLHVVNGKIRHSYDSWCCKSPVDTTSEEYMRESFAEAERYIRAYPDSENGTVFYEIGLPNH